MTAALLIALGLTDAAFSGFRAFAGRDGRIRKRDAKIHASVRGAQVGMVVLGLLGVLLVAMMRLDWVEYDELERAGQRMLTVYVVFATLIAVAFLAYFSPWLELRSVSTVLVFGPATFLRAGIIVGGAIYAGFDAPSVVRVFALIAGGLMLTVEPVLNRRFRREILLPLA